MPILTPLMPQAEATEFHVVTDRADELAGRSGEVRFLALPHRRYVMIDGDGPPLSESLAARMPALYATAWHLRFGLKARGVMTTVGPLEGMWWTAGTTDLAAIFEGDRTDWRWTLAIALPDQATDPELDEALASGRPKVQETLAGSLRVEWFDEGRVAQVLHLGPYENEQPTIDRLHAAISAAGFAPVGRHHEIYLGDPRRVAPERIRTILRQPVAVPAT